MKFVRGSVLWICVVLVVFFIFETPESFAARSTGAARSSRFGAGVMIGTMTSITGKYYLSNGNAVDFGLAFVPSPWTVLYGDYLWNFPGLFGGGSLFARQTTGYFGVGAGIGFWSHARDCYRYYCGTAYAGSTSTGLFVRAFFGAEWFPSDPPLGVFAEIGPAIGVMPGFGGAIDLGLGLRYFF